MKNTLKLTNQKKLLSRQQSIDNTLWAIKMSSFFILDTSVKTDDV